MRDEDWHRFFLFGLFVSLLVGVSHRYLGKLTRRHVLINESMLHLSPRGTK